MKLIIIYIVRAPGALYYTEGEEIEENFRTFWPLEFAPTLPAIVYVYILLIGYGHAISFKRITGTRVNPSRYIIITAELWFGRHCARAVRGQSDGF